MDGQTPKRGFWDRVRWVRKETERQSGVRKSKLRLLGLLFLFDALLISAVLLSFQEADLVEQVITLEKTREVYATVIIEQIITDTIVITQVVPYGSTR